MSEDAGPLLIYASIYLSIYLSIGLPIDRSIDRSIDLSIYLSIYLYTHQVSTLAKCDSACTKAREFVCVCVCDKTYLQIVPLP